jgi:hypothetical protein
VIDIDRLQYEGVVQTGESLTIEILTGEAGRERVATDRVRFTEMITGDPSNWVGAHNPNRDQPWRLWYRIDSPALDRPKCMTATDRRRGGGRPSNGLTAQSGPLVSPQRRSS